VKPLLLAVTVLAIAPLTRAASPSDLAGARAFLERLYAHYPQPANSAEFDPTGRDASEVFDPAMVGLFRRNARLTPKGDEGDLDYDPICGCQDDASMRPLVGLVRLVGSSRATAFVSLRPPRNAADRLVLDLARDGEGWRIHDIHSKDTPSLRAFMVQANREAAARGGGLNGPSLAQRRP